VLALFTAEILLHGRIATALDKQIRIQVQKLDLDLKFSKLDYGYFPPNVSLKKITFKNKNTIASAESINLTIRLWPLISGRFKAGNLFVDKLNASIKVQVDKKPSKTTLELELNKILKLIPIQHLLLSNSKLILLDKKNVFNFELEFLELEKLFSKLQLEIKSRVDLRTRDFKEDFLLNSKIRWQKKGFFISFFTLQKQKSILQLSGFIKKNILKLKQFDPQSFHKNITELRFSLNSDLEEFSPLMTKFIKPSLLKKAKYKHFEGRLQASAYYFPGAQKESSSKDRGSLQIKGDDLITPFASLKSLNFDGEIDSKSLKAKSLSVAFSEKSTLNLKDLTLESKNSNYYVSAQLSSDNVHIEDVIKSLNLQASNLKIPISINARCGGSLHKKMLIKCDGSSNIKSFDIYNSQDKSSLISTEDIQSKFLTYIKKDELNFEADLEHKDRKSKLKTTAQLNGLVNYITGFDLQFETSPLDLHFVKNISGLKFKGQTSLKGAAKGSSKWGTFQADLINKDFQLNNFFFGNSQGTIAYAFPLLTVKNIQGSLLDYENSYSGDFALNVQKNSMDIDFLGQQISDQGLRALFWDQFQLPPDLKFQSNLIVKAGGSTDINAMDVDLKTKATELNVFGEKFDSATIEISGQQGDWILKKGLLEKQASSIDARGGFKGLKSMDLRLISKNMNFEDSTFLKNLGLKITGPLNVTLNASGPFDGPEAVGTITSVDSRGPNKNQLGDSNLGYRLYEKDLFFKGDVFSNSFNGEGFYPLKPGGRLSLKGKFKNFDVLNFLNFNSENAKGTGLFINGESDFRRTAKENFSGTIDTMDVELKTEQRSLLKITQSGEGNFQKPISFKTLQKNDEATFILDLSRQNVNKISFNGSLDISFLQPLIPTCEFVSGRLMSDQLAWEKRSKKVLSSGVARIESSNFKSDAFPYSFSKISSQLNFDNNEIQIQNLSAFLSNTQIFGSGKIQTFAPPYIDLNFKYKNLNLEFPKKIFTTSDGRIGLKGSSIPLNIDGNLLIKEGVFAAELLNSSSSQTVMPNKRLPLKILRRSSPPADLKNVRIKIKNKMKVINTEADGFVSGDLVANGNPIDPVVNGKIQLKPGFKINFQDNTFDVKEGLINYKNKTLESPEVFVDASTSIKDNNDPLEKSYSVRMLASGYPQDLNIDFTSQPALDEKQIVSLLTIGTVSTQSLGQEINAQEQAAYSGFQFGSYLLQRNKAVKDLKKKTGIEIGVSSSLTSFGVSPKVEAKKGWTPKFSTALSQTFGNQRNLEFKNEYKLNKKTSTILGIQNNQTNDAAQLNNRRVRQGLILDLGLQYKFEFD